ncbi:glycosyltransferase [Malacoplasma iowae]|uniref:glycosyltransferase n=1 Tax=Malacoplasma iowae TaxID=2116 RepID=UPI0038736634|nr:glycosyltransferase [Malacoplasma iowae]
MVFVLYTTCNDFDSIALKKSLYQTYQNCKFFILDDSNDSKYKDEIDKFAYEYNIEVIRRKNRKGFKAGNINNFLMNRNDYDYFVLLDSDEIIPKDYILKVLPYFSNKKVGIVQCNNKCNRQNNYFDYLGSYVHNTQWNTEYVVRHSLGVVNCCGHGATISKKMYLDVGGFPELILEDWALTLNGLKFGYETVYAPEIVCWEEFPTNYLAFKKRNYRWTQGGVQCFSKIGWKLIFFNSCPFFRRLDLLLTQTNYFISIGSLIIVLSTLSILAPMGFRFRYENWYVAVTLFFAIIPLLNCFIYYLGRVNFFKLIVILLFFYILYASLFVSVIISIFEALIGKKLNFVVTPKKETKRISFIDAIKFNIIELIVGVILIIALIISFIYIPNVNFFTYVWVIILIIPMFLTVPLTLMSNIKLKNKNHEMENKYVI